MIKKQKRKTNLIVFEYEWGFVQVGYLLSGVLSSGVLSEWSFVQWVFVRLLCS